MECCLPIGIVVLAPQNARTTAPRRRCTGSRHAQAAADWWATTPGAPVRRRGVQRLLATRRDEGWKHASTLRQRAVSGDLPEAVALVVAPGAIRRQFGLPADALHARLPTR